MSRFPHNPTAYDDDWEAQPAQGAFYKWVLGVVLPLFFIGLGLFAMISRHAVLLGDHNQHLDLTGLNAIAMGLVALSAAMFLHCHYFWGNIYDQIWFAVLGKIVAGIGFVTGLIVVIIRVGIYGIS